MSDAVVFVFHLLQPVKIPAIEARGIVISRLNNQQGANEYKVSYWLNSEKKEAWLFENEMEPA